MYIYTYVCVSMHDRLVAVRQIHDYVHNYVHTYRLRSPSSFPSSAQALTYIHTHIHPYIQAALAKLLPFQRSDFEGIFKAMDG